MLFLRYYRGLYNLRGRGRSLSLAAKTWCKDVTDQKNTPAAPPPPPPPVPPPLEEVVSRRRDEAQRSLLVEIPSSSPSLVSDLCRECGRYGEVQAMFHYSIPQQGKGSREMMLVEYSTKSEVDEALRNATHLPSKDTLPAHSPLLWLAERKGAAPPSQVTPSPTVTVTPVVNQEDLMLRLSQCGNISEQMEILHNSTKLTELGTRLRFFTGRQVEASLAGLFPQAVVLPFGSSVNSFGSWNCDLDMSLELSGDETIHQFSSSASSSQLVHQSKTHPAAVNPRLALQRRMEVVAEILDYFMPGCTKVQKILNARVPIIKYQHDLTAIDCDLTMDNRSGYHMSRLLHLYGTADPRVSPLVCAVRRWAKCRALTNKNPGRWLTNFSFTQMVLTFLMNTDPPVLLPLNKMKITTDLDEKTGELVFVVPPTAAGIAAQAATRNTDSLEDLFMGFFAYYDKFNFRERGMSIVTGKNFVKPVHCALYIQNPLERDLNVSRNVTLEEVERLNTEVTHARFMMEGEDHTQHSTETPEPWGALRLWTRNGTVAFRHSAIDWQAMFHQSTMNAPPARPPPKASASPREKGTEGGQQLTGLVAKLKQKAQQRNNNNKYRHQRKGKVTF